MKCLLHTLDQRHLREIEVQMTDIIKTGQSFRNTLELSQTHKIPIMSPRTTRVAMCTNVSASLRGKHKWFESKFVQNRSQSHLQLRMFKELVPFYQNHTFFLKKKHPCAGNWKPKHVPNFPRVKSSILEMFSSSQQDSAFFGTHSQFP